MSWLAKSIANSLKLDDDDDDDYDSPNANATDTKSPQPDPQSEPKPDSPSPAPPTPTARGGVKGDLSELTQTLSRQFWGVASFLAPPPPPPDSSPPPPKPSDQADPSDPEPSEEDVIAGIRSDFAEIGGRFKSGIEKLSSNKAVSEFTKIASNLLQFGSEEEAEAAGAALGVTQEVLAFVRNISMHPETWLDFPLEDDQDSDDFELSDVQQEHALAVERLAPTLAALRIELCPEHMSEAHFWMIYFVLLHPRLSKHDAELLSTPKIVEARAKLTQELRKQPMEKPEESDPSGSGTNYARGFSDSPKEQHLSVPPTAQSHLVPPQTLVIRSAPLPGEVDLETEKHPVQSSEIQIIDKPAIEEEPVKETKYQLPPSNSSSKVLDDKYEDDADDWLKEESSEMDGVGGTSIPIENDEDVTFSDLEDDDGEVPSSYKKVTSGSDSSTKDSRDWVQLSRGSADSDKEINSVENRHAGSEQVSTRNLETKESNDWLDVDDIDVI